MPQTQQRSGGISLRSLIPSGQFFGADDIRARSACHEAQNCLPGDLFVALSDGPEDTHEQADIALSRGARAVLAERLLPVSVPQCVVDDTRGVYSQVCMELAGRPDQRLTTLGITGSHGKTSTSILLASILERADRQVGLMNSLGSTDSLKVSPPPSAEHQQIEIARCLTRMANAGCTEALVELSSRTLAQRQADGVELDAAIITNVRREHLDLHQNVQNYKRAKARIVQRLKTDGFVVANADDYTLRRMISNWEVPVITYGIHAECELQAQVVERCISEQTFLLNAGPESYPVRTSMIGNFHIYNCLAAAATAMMLGIDLDTIVRGLEAVERIPGRMERLECGQPFGVFLDTASSPNALASVLRASRQATSGRVICVFGAQSSTSVETRPELGRVAEKHADIGVITDAGAGKSLSVVHDVLDGYDRPAKAHVIPTRKRAIEWALDTAQEGDVVVIAGHKSGRGRRGNNAERAAVQQYLYDHAHRLGRSHRRVLIPMVSPN